MNFPRVLFVGRSTVDLLYRLDDLPAEDSKVYASHFLAAPGGPALNAALTHTRLGGASMLVSAVGSGKAADWIRAELEDLRIPLLDLALNTDYEAPLTAVLIHAANGSRTIVNPPISNTRLPLLSSRWEDALPADWSPMPSVVLTDGFHLEQTMPLLAVCKAAGARICLDGGSWKQGTAEAAPLLEAAICSERFSIPGHDNTPESLFAWFASNGVPCIARTRGAQAILGWERGRSFQIEVAPIDAIDTLGAGDVLHGAFAHYFASGDSFEAALRKAAKIATLSCQSLGVRSWNTL
jgi:sugar/nucleoside kinase (ribokinase family)